MPIRTTRLAVLEKLLIADNGREELFRRDHISYRVGQLVAVIDRAYNADLGALPVVSWLDQQSVINHIYPHPFLIDRPLFVVARPHREHVALAPKIIPDVVREHVTRGNTKLVTKFLKIAFHNYFIRYDWVQVVAFVLLAVHLHVLERVVAGSYVCIVQNFHWRGLGQVELCHERQAVCAERAIRV